MTVYGIQFWIECKGGLKTANELSDALDDLVYDGNLSLAYDNHSIMGAGLFMKNAIQNNFESIREILNEFADKIKYVSEWDYEDSSDMKWGVHTLGESKKSARKSIKESKAMSYDEFKKIVKKEFTKDEIEGFGKTDNGYGVYVIAYGEKEIEIMCDDLRQYGFECKWWHSSDPEDDEPIYFIEAIPIMNESKNSTRKSIKESKNMTFSFKESELFVDIKHIIDGEKINFHKKISTDFVYDLNEFKDICDELCKTENLYYIVYENKTSFKGDYNLVFFDIDDVDMRRNGEILFNVISDYNKEVIKFFNE